MKSPAGPPPRFFLDRSLGVYWIAEALRDAGLEVQTMRKRYGEQVGQRTRDEKWIEEATKDGYILLHKDKRIRFRDIERQAMVRSHARSFALSNGNLSGADACACILRNREKILRAVRLRRASYFYVILENKVEPRRLDR